MKCPYTEKCGGCRYTGECVDVVFMDPPRSGSSEQFIRSLVMLAPDKVVYILLPGDPCAGSFSAAR